VCRLQSPDLIKNQEEIAHIKQRLDSSAKSATKLQADFDEQRKEVNALETELSEVRKKAGDFEAQVQEREAQEKLVLSEDQLEQYNKRKQEAGRETAPIKQELEGLIRQQRLDTEMRDTSDAKLRDLQARTKHLSETEEQYERRYSKVQEFIDQTEAKKKELEGELATVSAANKAASEQQEKLMAQLEEIHEQLNEAKVDIRSDQREIRFREALESMKRIFPGVIGRMVHSLSQQRVHLSSFLTCKTLAVVPKVDLVEPQARQYHVAVSVVLGRNIEAIVVDDSKTAEECINVRGAPFHPSMLCVLGLILTLAYGAAVSEGAARWHGNLPASELAQSEAHSRASAQSAGNQQVGQARHRSPQIRQPHPEGRSLRRW
jgi:structural maintenance of chromosome 1